MNACASAVQVHQNNLHKFLQINDPTVTKIMIQIGLSGLGIDSYQQRHIPKRLADALESNLYITEIHVELTDFPLPFPDFDFQVERQQQEQQTILSRWEPFIQAMSKRDNLKSVILSGESRLGHSHYHPMFGLCLRAFQVNKSITSIEFIDVVFHNNEICDFLDNATSITKFVLGGGFILDDNDGYESFAVALQRNSNIQFLDVVYIHSPNHVVVPILFALKSNINLKSLSIGKILFHWAGPLCQLIEETKTLQRLELHDNYDSFTMTWDIGRLNRAIIESESLTELVLFNNLNLPWRNFSSILLNKSNLNFLSLSNRNLVVGNDPMITALCSCLTRPDSSIKTLEFDTSLYSMSELLRNYTALTDVLQAVCDSTTLESFKIGFDDDLKAVNRKLFPSLISYIPSMKIKELQIVIVTTMSPNIVVSDETTEQLLQSIKNNYTIKKVVCTNSTTTAAAKGGDGGNNKSLFENNHKQIEKLHFYMDRNTRLEQFMKQPKIIDNKELWPEGLQLISHRGTSDLYHFLRGGEGQPNLHQLVCGGGSAADDDDDSQNAVTYHDMDHDMENHDMEEQVEEKKMAAK